MRQFRGSPDFVTRLQLFRISNCILFVNNNHPWRAQAKERGKTRPHKAVKDEILSAPKSWMLGPFGRRPQTRHSAMASSASTSLSKLANSRSRLWKMGLDDLSMDSQRVHIRNCQGSCAGGLQVTMQSACREGCVSGQRKRYGILHSLNCFCRSHRH